MQKREANVIMFKFNLNFINVVFKWLGSVWLVYHGVLLLVYTVYNIICQCVRRCDFLTTQLILKSILAHLFWGDLGFNFEDSNRMLHVIHLGHLDSSLPSSWVSPLHWLKKKKRKAHSQSKTMRAHDAQLAPSVSKRGGVFPPGGSVACVCAPTGGRRTTGI